MLFERFFNALEQRLNNLILEGISYPIFKLEERRRKFREFVRNK